VPAWKPSISHLLSSWPSCTDFSLCQTKQENTTRMIENLNLLKAIIRLLQKLKNPLLLWLRVQFLFKILTPVLLRLRQKSQIPAWVYSGSVIASALQQAFYKENQQGMKIKSDKLREKNFNEVLDDFVMKQARTKHFVYCENLSSNCLLYSVQPLIRWL